MIVKLGNQEATAKVRVAEPKKKGKHDSLAGKKRGFLKDIISDELLDPTQRVFYKDGIIRIYINFPSVSKYIRAGLDGVETSESRMLLAELVGESFCRELARRGIDMNKYPKMLGGEIDSFMAAINELQKKYLHKIQKIIFAWNFK